MIHDYSGEIDVNRGFPCLITEIPNISIFCHYKSTFNNVHRSYHQIIDFSKFTYLLNSQLFKRFKLNKRMSTVFTKFHHNVA